MPVKITPTIGRVVWYHADHSQAEKPLPALICEIQEVSTDAGEGKDPIFGHRLNLGGFNREGHPFNAVDVPLIQEGDSIPRGEQYASWMPYQHSQAANATKKEN